MEYGMTNSRPYRARRKACEQRAQPTTRVKIGEISERSAPSKRNRLDKPSAAAELGREPSDGEPANPRSQNYKTAPSGCKLVGGEKLPSRRQRSFN